MNYSLSTMNYSESIMNCSVTIISRFCSYEREGMMCLSTHFYGIPGIYLIKGEVTVYLWMIFIACGHVTPLNFGH